MALPRPGASLPNPTSPAHYTLASSRNSSRASSWCGVLSSKAEPWCPGAVGSAAGASPVGNKKPALGAETLAGTTGAGKGGGSGAWEWPAGVAEDWSSGLSGGLQAAVPGLELKKSRSDCPFYWEWKVRVSRGRRGFWLPTRHLCWEPCCNPTGLALRGRGPRAESCSYPAVEQSGKDDASRSRPYSIHVVTCAYLEQGPLAVPS